MQQNYERIFITFALLMASPTPIFDVQGITKRFGDLLLFENVSFSLSEGQHVGLIARNGAGKTTLLDILAGKETADEGKMILRRDTTVGYLNQQPTFAPGMRVIDACADKKMLTQLDITDYEAPIAQLSGGQVKRVALAAVLTADPDILILDEPTNHLDVGMVEWLETYLRRHKKTLFMVTHDRYFLDNVCSDIFELDPRGIFTYKGTYADFLEQKNERLQAESAQIQKAANLYRTELDWMRRMPCARGHKARYRQEAFYELEKLAKKRIEEKNLSLKAGDNYIGSKIFEAKNVSKAFGEKIILKDFNYIFARHEKLGIVGANGAGKRTFIRLLLGDVAADGGHFDVGEPVRFGHFSQHTFDFKPNEKVIDAIRAIAETIETGKGKITASQLLTQFLFPPSRQQDYIAKLSGGERRRLQLCMVLMRNPNFLILDEPTNDLDIVTLQVLEEYLEAFKGCVIVVSHDRYFMDKVVDHLLVFKGNGEIQDFPGGYTHYREWQERKDKEALEAAEKSAAQPGKQNTWTGERKRRLSFKEKREMEQLEADIAVLVSEKAGIEAALCSGELSVDELTEKSKRLPLLEEELDEKSMRWLELSEVEG